MNNELIYVPTKKYVYFNEDGDITAITNTQRDEGQCIEVHQDDVKAIIEGTERLTAYSVVFDTFYKQYRLKHKHINDNSFVSILDNIYEVKEQENDEYDIKIVQDKKQKIWKFELDPTLRLNLKATSSSLSGVINFSITRQNDPHELIHMIKLSFAQLVNNETVTVSFFGEKMFDNSGVSVYTMKKFENYHYEVIDE